MSRSFISRKDCREKSTASGPEGKGLATCQSFLNLTVFIRVIRAKKNCFDIFIPNVLGEEPDNGVLEKGAMERKRILSGMRPTGKLHLGNLHGALTELEGTSENIPMLFFYCRLACPDHRI